MADEKPDKSKEPRAQAETNKQADRPTSAVAKKPTLRLQLSNDDEIARAAGGGK